MYPTLNEQVAKEQRRDMLARAARDRRPVTPETEIPVREILAGWRPDSATPPALPAWRRVAARGLIALGARIVRREPHEVLGALGWRRAS